MTEQYLEEDINGQPSPLSLRANPLAPAIAGAIDDVAIFWPSLAADAAIIGEGLSVLGDASVGSIIQVAQPGLYSVSLTTTEDPVGTSAPLNIIRGAPAAITAGNGYPALDYLSGIPLGAEAVGFTPAGLPPPINEEFSAIFRVTGTDLVDPVGGINPRRQIRFAALGPAIPGLFPPGTLISVARVSR